MVVLAVLLSIVACDDQHSEPPPAPIPEPVAAAGPAPELEVGAFAVVSGLCEPSGIAPDGVVLRMVDDDRKKLVFSSGLAGGAAEKAKRARDGEGVKLDDAEAVAVDGEERWWVTSHSRNKSGERKPAREVLVRTDRTGLSVLAVHSLAGLREGLAVPACPECTVPADFEGLPSKQGGLDIEGLAVGTSGDLIVGLRGPLTTEQKALVLSVPKATLEAATISQGWALDLGNRGVRSIERIPGEDTFLLIAGPMDARVDFDLYRWTPGQEAVHIAEIPLPEAGTAPEGLAILSQSAEAVSLVIAYDEGGRFEASCDDLLDGDDAATVTARLLPMTWRR